MRVISYVLVSLVMSLMAACRNESNDSQVNYAVFANSQQNSLLLTIDRTNLLSICISERIPTVIKKAGISQSQISKRLDEVRQHSESSLRTWLSFLEPNKFWRRRNVKFNFYMGNAECLKMPADGVKIVTDVGQAADPSKVCGKDSYIAEPDGRLCRAYAQTFNRSVYLASSGWHGDVRVIAHELGHILGLGDVYDEKDRQSGIEFFNEASIMGRSSSFQIDDFLGINGVWNYIKFGVACGKVTEMNADVESVYNVLHCAVKENRPALIQADGKATCEIGYKLTTGQICVSDFGRFPADAPRCPANAPDYDPKMGVCCPTGKRYSTATMSCEDPQSFQKMFGNIRSSPN